MGARKKRTPAAETTAVATVSAPAVASGPAAAALATKQVTVAPTPGSVLMNAIAWPFEVAIVLCLLPFGRRPGAK